eukprot:1155301-Prorocentrum_minimum.AAC.2
MMTKRPPSPSNVTERKRLRWEVARSITSLCGLVGGANGRGIQPTHSTDAGPLYSRGDLRPGWWLCKLFSRTGYCGKRGGGNRHGLVTPTD